MVTKTYFLKKETEKRVPTFRPKSRSSLRLPFPTAACGVVIFISKTKYFSFMDLVKYLAVSTILFLLGIWGIFLNRKNIIIMLMSIELMLLAVNLNFLLFSVYLDDLVGQLFALFVLTVAAAESAIGLALLVIYYRVRGTIAVEFINLIKG